MHSQTKTGTVTLEGKTFEVELNRHHIGRTYGECEKDCPAGWHMPTYQLLQEIRNSADRDKFNLLETSEYVQQPDVLSKERGLVAGFVASSDGAILSCAADPKTADSVLGVRYVRKLSGDPIPRHENW